MYTTWRHIRLYAAMAMLMAFACAAVSCITESGECPPPAVDKETKEVFRLRFQICSRISDSTRAADVSHHEEGSVAENIIDVDDISYLLFDGDGKFILTLKPEATVTSVISEDYALYEVVAKIGNDQDRTDYFKSHWSGQVDFYLLAIANYSGYGAIVPQLQTGDYIKNLFDTNPIVAKNLPDTESILKGSPGNDDTKGKSLIPMAGLQFFSLNGSWFETQTGETPIDLTFITGKSLNMLRAISKLEVIDKINIKPGEKYDAAKDDGNIRISGASICGVMKTGRMLPAFGQWKRNEVLETQQVEEPSVTGFDDYLLPPILNDDGEKGPADAETANPYSLRFFYDKAETEKRKDLCPVYSCYIWEYAFLEAIPKERRPYLSLTVRNPALTGTGTPQTAIPATVEYNIPLYSDMTANPDKRVPVKAFLRNHIYRYEISGTAADLAVKWSVCPMDEASADIIYN